MPGSNDPTLDLYNSMCMKEIMTPEFVANLTKQQAEPRDFVKDDRTEAQRYINLFIAAINADHSDRLIVPRDVGCCMRNEIERLRRVEARSVKLEAALLGVQDDECYLDLSRLLTRQAIDEALDA